jgi:hypothetical protein
MLAVFLDDFARHRDGLHPLTGLAVRMGEHKRVRLR